jgi:hypothetical protein
VRLKNIRRDEKDFVENVFGVIEAILVSHALLLPQVQRLFLTRSCVRENLIYVRKDGKSMQT